MSKKVKVIDYKKKTRTVNFTDLLNDNGSIVGVTFAPTQDLSALELQYKGRISFYNCTITGMILPAGIDSVQFFRCDVDDLKVIGAHDVLINQSDINSLVLDSPDVARLKFSCIRSGVHNVELIANKVYLRAFSSCISDIDMTKVVTLDGAEFQRGSVLEDLYLGPAGIKVTSDIHIEPSYGNQVTMDGIDERFIMTGEASIIIHTVVPHVSSIWRVCRAADHVVQPFIIKSHINDDDLADPAHLIGTLPIHRYVKSAEDAATGSIAFTGNTVSVGCQHLNMKDVRRLAKFFLEGQQDVKSNKRMKRFINMVDASDCREELVAHWAPVLMSIIDTMKEQRARTIKHMDEFGTATRISTGL